MDQINVQRWASTLRQFDRDYFQNLDDCQLAVASSSSTNNNTRRISSHHYFLPTSPALNDILNESLTSSACVPSIVTDVHVSSENGVRNLSTTIKTRENKPSNDKSKYSFTLDFSSPKKDSVRGFQAQFYTFDMTTKVQDKLRRTSDAQLSENKTSTLPTPSTDSHDIDVISDAETYVIEDDANVVQDHKPKPTINPSSSTLKRYVNRTKKRHGTFDIHGMIPPATHTVNRPVVDSHIPTRDLLSSSNSSSASSLHSFPDDNEHTVRQRSDVDFQNKLSDSFTYARNTLSQQQQQQSITPQKNPIKPAECFVISPAHETKMLSTTNAPQRKVEAPWKSGYAVKSVPTKDSNLETTMTQSSSSQPSTRPHQNSTENRSSHLHKQPSSTKAAIRPHTAINDHTHSSSNSTIHSTVPVHGQHQRPASTSSTTNHNDRDETSLNLTKVYMNKSFLLRQQRSNLVPSTSKPVPPPPQQQQTASTISSRQPLKKSTSTASAVPSTGGQTNRAVELRRARAQAKIEELAQRTGKQFHKINNDKTDLMSTSWHSNANSVSKTNSASLRSNPRTTLAPERQDMLKTRTISTAVYHRSSSASPHPSEEKPSRYRQVMIGNVTDAQKSQRMNTSAYHIGTERCDLLRENGQRLAIRLIQLSSGILEKLKLNDTAIDDTASMRDLEQVIDKLQTVNQTLTTIDTALTGPTNDDPFI